MWNWNISKFTRKSLSSLRCTENFHVRMLPQAFFFPISVRKGSCFQVCVVFVCISRGVISNDAIDHSVPCTSKVATDFLLSSLMDIFFSKLHLPGHGLISRSIFFLLKNLSMEAILEISTHCSSVTSFDGESFNQGKILKWSNQRNKISTNVN